MSGWYARPVLSVADVERTAAFYIDRLGFQEDWRHDHEGRPIIVQLSREGCELIFGSQWPEKTDKGVIFISLDRSELEAVRAQLEAEGTAFRDGWWGYDLLIVDDPDGHQLWFPWPSPDKE